MQPRTPAPPNEATNDASQSSRDPAPRAGAEPPDPVLDRELDRELDDTFPASDPIPWSHEVK